MKIIKSSETEIKQLHLDSYKNRLMPDTVYQIKETSKGRNQGVFVVKILPKGDIDFYFYYFIDGKEKSKKIGRFGKNGNYLTLAQAKSRFRELSSLYNKGVDPKVQEQEIAKQIAEEKQIQDEIEAKKQLHGNIGQLTEYFLEHLKREKGEKHYRNVSNAFKHDLGIIDINKKASDITKSDIIAILHTINNRGAAIMANRMRAYLSSMFNYGIAFDDSVETLSKKTKFYIQINPVQSVKKITQNENRGDRALSEQEVKIFWDALDSSKMSEFKKNAFKLMLITGARVEEISGLKWNEIDFEQKIITLSSNRTKNKREHIIPLNDMALDVIQHNKKLNDIYLFPSENGENAQRVDGFSQSISRLLKNVQIEKFVPRDLRRTFKTLTGKAKISKEIRDRLQNHALQDVSSLHYDRHDYLDEKREAMGIWNDYLLNIVSIE